MCSCLGSKKISVQTLNPSEWEDQKLPADYSDNFKFQKDDIFINENWEQISGLEYLSIYRYYKHKKALYKKGNQQAFKLESAPEKTNRYKKNIDNIELLFKTKDQAAPAFELTGLDGEKLSKEDLEGKVVIFNFWFVKCPPCRKEIPELNNLANEFKDNKDVIFIAPSLNDMEQLAAFTKKQPFDYILAEKHEGLSDQFSVPAYPTHVVMDKKGVVRFATVGGQVEGIMHHVFSDLINNLL